MNNQREVKDRILKFIHYLSITQKEFAENIGSPEKYMSNVLSNGNIKNVTLGLLHKIKDAYPEINIEWFKTGDGDMFINNNIVNEPAASYGLNSSDKLFLEKVIDTLNSQIAMKDNEIKRLLAIIEKMVDE